MTDLAKKLRIKKLLPGENTIMLMIAITIGVTAGFANILFRIVTELVTAWLSP